LDGAPSYAEGNKGRADALCSVIAPALLLAAARPDARIGQHKPGQRDGVKDPGFDMMGPLPGQADP